MKKRNKILLSVIIGVLAISAVFIVVKRKKTAVSYITETVEKGELIQTVSATGALTSQEEIDLNFEIPGRLAEINLKVGQEVVEGEVIAKLDSDILNKKVGRTRLALEKAIADAGTSNNKIREAKQEVENADKYLSDCEELEDQKVDSANEEYSGASDYYDDALDYYNKVKEEEGSDSATTLSAKLTVTKALNQKNSSEEAKQTAEKTKEMNLRLAKNILKSAQEDLKTAQSNYGETSRDSAVSCSRTDYEIAFNNLRKAELKSPVSGTLTKINYEKGEVLGLAGSGIGFGKVLTPDFIIKVNISESDIVKVSVSQKAEITFDSLPLEDVYNGKVVEIEPQATIIEDVVYYEAKIKLESLDSRLKVGMSADVEIVTNKKENVFSISQQAIKREGSKKEIEILLDDNKIQTLEVQTGAEGDGGVIEIKTGLNGGERVILYKEDQK